MEYQPDLGRYDSMKYRRCGQSGLKLPEVSLGLWHNFGEVDNIDNQRRILYRAFDCGITHFDLANNYGPPAGSAEADFGKILHEDFRSYRDEMVISSKAGYTMWKGPYGDWGSKKYLVSSLNQSLKRLRLDYVDIFYHHRPDPETPLEETMQALDLMVRQGKALYVGISNYPAPLAEKAIQLLKSMGTPCLIHQARYSMLDRWVESELLDCLEKNGVGCIAFSPLAQGLLTNRYINGIPSDSRIASASPFLKESQLTAAKLEAIKNLNKIAVSRGQSLAQMALSWILKDSRITSVLVGASRPEQLDDSLGCLTNLSFSAEQIAEIESVLSQI